MSLYILIKSFCKTDLKNHIYLYIITTLLNNHTYKAPWQEGEILCCHLKVTLNTYMVQSQLAVIDTEKNVKATWNKFLTKYFHNIFCLCCVKLSVYIRASEIEWNHAELYFSQTFASKTLLIISYWHKTWWTAYISYFSN